MMRKVGSFMNFSTFSSRYLVFGCDSLLDCLWPSTISMRYYYRYNRINLNRVASSGVVAIPFDIGLDSSVIEKGADKTVKYKW